jgi:ubiquinone/menaquinone biosynthesis C-methylase UbiE
MTQHRCSCGSDESVKADTRVKYEQQWGRHDERAAAERRRNLAVVADPLLRTLLPFGGKTVVDLGIGTGSMAFRAVELSPPGRLIGVDFSSSGLGVSRMVSHSEQFGAVDIELVLGDLERVPLVGRCADIVLSQATFNLLPNKQVAMSEIARIAKPGARIAVSDAFRTKKRCAEESWEACVAGAVTVAEFSTLALSAGMIISQQMDLTQQVKQLVGARKWDWPEFVEHNMDYRAFVMLRA